MSQRKTLPYHGEPLPACRTAACKDDCLVLAMIVLKELEDLLIVQDRVQVVHLHGIRTVVESDVQVRNTLAKVSLRT